MPAVSPMAGRSRRIAGNRVRQFDFATLLPGQVLHVRTHQSDWYFGRTTGGHATGHQVKGVFVHTSSRAFGQICRNPANVTIDRVIEKGRQIHINGELATGDVEQMFLGGVELT